MVHEHVIPAIRELLDDERYREELRRVDAACPQRLRPLIADLHAEIAQLRSSPGRLPLYLLDALPERLSTDLQALAPDERGVVAKQLVAGQLESLPRRLQQSALPETIVAQYATTIGYMTRWMIDVPDPQYGALRASFFDRDLRMAAGFSLPVGSQIIDLHVWAPPSLYRNQGLKENLRCLAFVAFRLGGLGPLVRIHLDARNVENFNESGRNACYRRIARLMKVQPEIRGMIGTSWFYDPQLQQVSPKLAYLARVPLENGALLRMGGAAEINTQRALERSPTRRRLYEEGRYKPISATVIWPRAGLMRFARTQGEDV